MDDSRFRDLNREILNKCLEVLKNKRVEYAPTDRLGNFKRRAELLGKQPEEIIVSDLTKHIDVIIQAAKTGNYRWCWEDEKGEGLKQRIVDAINYLLLLAGCFKEKQDYYPEITE